MKKTIDFYHAHAEHLNEQYNSVSFEVAHQVWREWWPQRPCTVLDIGAGNGRDARWLAERGCSIVAVEPAANLRAFGEQSSEAGVQWLEDRLPDLHKVLQLGMRFDLILLSAVWMHIPESDRQRCFRKLSNLLSPNGILVISLRFGDFNDGRTSFLYRRKNSRRLQKNMHLQRSYALPMYQMD